MSSNHNAIHILKNNLNKINVDELRENENGFELLILLRHRFQSGVLYHKNIVLAYFDGKKMNFLQL